MALTLSGPNTVNLRGGQTFLQWSPLGDRINPTFIKTDESFAEVDNSTVKLLPNHGSNTVTIGDSSDRSWSLNEHRRLKMGSGDSVRFQYGLQKALYKVTVA